LGREAADDEVPEPVGCSGGGETETAHALVEHLAVDDPGSAVPTGGVEGSLLCVCVRKCATLVTL
jgi:hypothetical protein